MSLTTSVIDCWLVLSHVGEESFFLEVEVDSRDCIHNNITEPNLIIDGRWLKQSITWNGQRSSHAIGSLSPNDQRRQSHQNHRLSVHLGDLREILRNPSTDFFQSLRIRALYRLSVNCGKTVRDNHRPIVRSGSGL